MPQQKINEDILLLLVENNGIIDTTTVKIDNRFEYESIILKKICEGGNDNINEIINFINKLIKPKLPNKVFNYCQSLDDPYQSVIVDIEEKIQEIRNLKNSLYAKQEEFIKKNKKYDLEGSLLSLKIYIRVKLELWFKAFNIEIAYNKAVKLPNMLVYSHRISGWSKPEYKITENLKQEIRTNFGYGKVSYFYSLLTYKNIQITPLSEWIDYRYSCFSEVIRYTRNYRSKIPIFDERGNLKYYRTKIVNSYWYNAIEFTKNAANLSLVNEKEFIEKYIISECEKMVRGLENIYNETEFEFIDENQLNIENNEIIKYKVDINGYQLIDFRTEKIIGALDFLSKLTEYNSIFPTSEYIQRIITLNKQFIPNVYIALDNQNILLKKANEDYDTFIINHNQLIEKNKFYQNEKSSLKNEFDTIYNVEYYKFQVLFTKSNEELTHHNHNIKLHTDNIKKLTDYINKYKRIVVEE